MNKWLMVTVVACIPTLAMAQSFRCNDKIISEGTSRAKVAALCGDPAQIDQQPVLYRAIAPAGRRSGLTLDTTVQIQVEVWIYNFGPDRLMQRVRFEDGYIVRIDSIGYGY
jgi:uncharacterized protein DUF2845